MIKNRTPYLLALLVAAGIASLSAAGFLLVQGSEALLPRRSDNIPPQITNAAPVLDQPAGVDLEIETKTRPAPTSFPPNILTIYLQDGTNEKVLSSAASTVAGLVAEANILLGENDSITPALETPLTEKMRVEIKRASPLTIQVDGQTLAVFSSAGTIAEALSSAGIALGALDMVSPPLESDVSPGERIKVTRVREDIVAEDTEVPFQTVYQPSDELDLDTKAVLSSGTPGLLRRSTRIRYEDGVEVSREAEGEWMEREVVNQVVGYGTRINTNVIETPQGPREYWRVVHMRVTAYTAASSGKAPDHPAYGITASGLPAGTGIVAVDPNVIPFRSEVFVPGYGIGYAGDTGGGVKGRWIDLGYDEQDLQTWNGYVDVYYLTPVPAEINYLLPEVLP